MQEVFQNGSEGKVYVADSVEELVPHIKKSLEKPGIESVKVFKTLKGKKRFAAAEEKEEELDPIEEFEIFVESYQEEEIFKEKLKECLDGELFKTILSLCEPKDYDPPEVLKDKKEVKKEIEKAWEFMLMHPSKILKKMGTKAGEKEAK